MRKKRLTVRGLLVALLATACATAIAQAQTVVPASSVATRGAFAVGQGPEGVTSDGTNVFVANQFSNNVTKLSANGATVGTYTVGRRPVALAFDGANLWVANYLSNNVM